MKLAYVTTHDSSDVEAWSGLVHQIRGALSSSGCDIVTIDNLLEGWSARTTARRLYYEKIALKQFRREREPSILRFYASQVANELASLDCDVVFSPGTLPIAYLRTDRPIVFWTDATFRGMVDFYPGFTNLCADSIRRGEEAEQHALSQCRLAIYCSEWAASTALRHYMVDPEKVRIVPFGANMRGLRDVGEVAGVLASKDWDTCRLLFVGVDWVRKRGDFAVAVAELMNQHGLRTELNVVGCHPPRAVPDFVKVHGYASKTSRQGAETLERLFRECHVLLHPCLAECFGVVLAEAGSYALPCATANVGGTSSVVKNGVNGQLFNADDGLLEYAKYIQGVFESKDEYERLAFSSFNEYAERLNWAVAGRRVRELIEEVLL